MLLANDLLLVGSIQATRGSRSTSAQQIIGREGETAALLSRCLFTLNLRGGGFAPRHLNR